jgi:hypothetical protein
VGRGQGKGALVSIDLKREKNWKGKKCLACSKWKVVKKGKIKCPPQVMCGSDIKRLLDGTSHCNNEFIKSN